MPAIHAIANRSRWQEVGMAEIPPDVREKLEEHPWEDTISRLALYTIRKAKRLYWQGIMNGNMPAGKEAQDVVQDAIEDVLTGQRSWNPATQPDLFVYLRRVVDSKLSHLVESMENRSVRSESALGARKEDAPGITFIAEFPDSGPSPFETLIQAEAEDFFWGFYEFLADEPLLQNVVECIDGGINKSTDIAIHLGVPPKEIYNVRKRLQRRLHDYRAQRGQQSFPGKGGKTNG
jgi:DNA-directed RNA polymerase specialized sigma24 family protein